MQQVQQGCPRHAVLGGAAGGGWDAGGKEAVNPAECPPLGVLAHLILEGGALEQSNLCHVKRTENVLKPDKCSVL